MKGSKLAVLVLTGIGVACVAFIVFILHIKGLWAWTVPDLFPGAVEKGLVASSISWATAMKLAILLAVLSAFAGGHRSSSRHEHRGDS